MNTIYIVDEEYHFAENVASALRFEGRNAVVFHDATDALLFFMGDGAKLTAAEVVLLVDVSLAAGDDLDTFSSDATDDFSETGIVLVQQLLARRSGLISKTNTILYTAHYATELWTRIEEFCRLHEFRNWQKTPHSSVEDVVALV